MLKKTDVKYLIIHCSDTPENKNLSAVDIHKMHIGFGWDGVGYHKIIDRGGNIESGRPEYWVGAHVKGLNNISLGVCLIGRNNFLDVQFDALRLILKEWKKKYPKAIIMGHRDSIKTSKTCPNFDVINWCKMNKIF